MAVFLLVMLPMLVALTALSAETARIVEGSSVDLSRAAADAVRSAASAVDPASQANGDPRIDPDKAFSAFCASLKDNLGLNDELCPKTGSRLAVQPEFQLYVYNGEAKYGLPAFKGYVFQDGMLNEVELVGEGFPYTFGIDDGGIVPGGPGERTVTLDCPGAVAFVKGELRPVVFSKGGTAARWAAAKVVYKTGL